MSPQSSPSAGSPRIRLREALAPALFLPVVLFVSTPSNVILRNLADIPYTPRTPLMFLGLFVLSSAVLIPVFRRAESSRLCGGLARGALGCGLAIGVFDGASAALHATHHGSFLVAAILDEVIVFLIIILVVRAPFRALAGFLGAASAILILYTAAMSAQAYASVRTGAVGPAVETESAEAVEIDAGQALMFAAISGLSAEERAIKARIRARAETEVAHAKRTPRVANAPDAAAGPGNVYHILLDGFQGAAYSILVNDDPTLALPGFTHFPWFTANYGMTIYSVPSVLGGRMYAPAESVSAWRQKAIDFGLWADLARGGWDVSLYPFFAYDCSPWAVVCHDTQRFGDSPIAATTDIWFLSVLPGSLRRVFTQPFAALDTAPASDQFDLGFSITDRLRPSIRARTRIHPGDMPVLAKLNFERMIEDENARPARGQYVYLHMMSPHPPLVLQNDCAYVPGRRDLGADLFLAQAACALRLVQRFLDRLDELGRLDSALIIIHADHGQPLRVADALFVEYGPYLDGASLLPWNASDTLAARAAPRMTETPDHQQIHGNPWHVAARSNALLLVKFPGHTQNTTAADPRQMIDIAPTVLAHAGLSTAAYPGLSLSRTEPLPQRPVRFHAGVPQRPNTIPAGNTFSEYVLEDGVWRFDYTVHVSP